MAHAAPAATRVNIAPAIDKQRNDAFAPLARMLRRALPPPPHLYWHTLRA